ncbi:CPBP family intramembrane glutamic endopeptidase [Clostridium oryzae]|uniref:CAAX amino terminal protease self-immunity n=1 Tax=Clostridium oryzae TaxID=1450648 RepID=A0A1V4IHV6_9CLOT|nr:CPBP family intramembrane glutamic endopeptidase [Clostridium oryzae]OPJ59582.1 CAAX amino terminal protease self- immunity [Clostridium oryzae]
MEKNQRNIQTKRRLLAETLIVIIITILLFLIFNKFSSIIPVIPAIYLLIEKRKRHRSWSDIGFKIKNIFSDLRMNWYLVLLVGVISPLLTFMIGKYCIPGFTDHVKSRLPMDINVIAPTIITITISTFLEEVIFRGFLQGRLEWFIPPTKSIIISSCIFTLMHYSSGSIPIVALDMLGIFVDSIIYGIIFTKTKNLFASWIGHYLSDLIGIVCLFFLI